VTIIHAIKEPINEPICGANPAPRPVHTAAKIQLNKLPLMAFISVVKKPPPGIITPTNVRRSGRAEPTNLPNMPNNIPLTARPIGLSKIDPKIPPAALPAFPIVLAILTDCCAAEKGLSDWISPVISAGDLLAVLARTLPVRYIEVYIISIKNPDMA